MSRWHFNFTLIAFLCVTIVARSAMACERCRALRTTAFHDPALSGDDPADAVFPPSDGVEQGGSGAFTASGTKWPQPGGLGTPVTLTYSYQNMFDGGLRGPGAIPLPNGVYLPDGPPLPNDLIRQSIEEAFGLWASVAPLVFVEVEDDGLTYAQGSTRFGQIRFRHVYINGPDPPHPAQPIAKAQAYFPNSSVLGGDVEFDHGDPWQEVGTRPQPDILGAAIHEIGHTLGLGHTSISAANMYPIFIRYSGLGTGALHADDIAGVQSLYGAGQGAVIPLSQSVPEPATVVLFFLAGLRWLARHRCR